MRVSHRLLPSAIAEVQTEEGKLYLFVGIERTSTFAYGELHTEATRATARSFLEQRILSVPYKIPTILTDNGIPFTNRKRDVLAFMASFDRVCCERGIEIDFSLPAERGVRTRE